MVRSVNRFARRVGAGVAVCAVLVTPAAAQQFTVFDRDVQVHGSVQQGLVLTDGNNFLTMDTNSGSAEMTDGALNVSIAPARKLRVGAQVYARNVGQLGNGRPGLDWAFVDYRVHEVFGIRAGKVKTPMGLFNDTQDMEFLYTWALLPQGVYPSDLRSVSIAHVGADVYGAVSLSRAGRVDYTVYGGTIPDDARGGYRYGVEDAGLKWLSTLEKRGVGFDLRWTTPVDGLSAGYSLLDAGADARLEQPVGPISLPVDLLVDTWRSHAIFGEFNRGRLRLSAEYRDEVIDLEMRPPSPFPATAVTLPGKSWLAAAAFRVSAPLEIGVYRTQYVANTGLPSSDPDNHVYDTAVAARLDVTSFFHVKAEGHFMDGYGSPSPSHGFYARNNASGFTTNTTMLVLRTGLSF
jgi:hypothetical protein